ncbi:hypothetical protein EX30DRAFT_349709 [Ascodesmis nigricans]|uniref:Uncharacterized protein n=1 Tax=Ascodesmis nigricans TaxID=341454 RepID=A0A4V3SIG2_9PEZI|nr:hypothetical protein EX30DRAFT_349709 [Ascodesmis nigricans]
MIGFQNFLVLGVLTPFVSCLPGNTQKPAAPPGTTFTLNLKPMTFAIPGDKKTTCLIINPAITSAPDFTILNGMMNCVLFAGTECDDNKRVRGEYYDSGFDGKGNGNEPVADWGRFRKIQCFPKMVGGKQTGRD